jgi:hypothetical protein
MMDGAVGVDFVEFGSFLILKSVKTFINHAKSAESTVCCAKTTPTTATMNNGLIVVVVVALAIIADVCNGAVAVNASLSVRDTSPPGSSWGAQLLLTARVNQLEFVASARCMLTPIGATRNDAGNVFAPGPPPVPSFSQVFSDFDLASGANGLMTMSTMRFVFSRALESTDYVLLVDVNSPDSFVIVADSNDAVPVPVAAADFGSAPVPVISTTVRYSPDNMPPGDAANPRAVAISGADLLLVKGDKTARALIISNATGLDLVFIAILEPSQMCATSTATTTTTTTKSIPTTTLTSTSTLTAATTSTTSTTAHSTLSDPPPTLPAIPSSSTSTSSSTVDMNTSSNSFDAGAEGPTSAVPVVADKTLIYALSGAIACLLLVILGALVAWLVSRGKKSTDGQVEMMSARSDRFGNSMRQSSPYGDFSPIPGVPRNGDTFASTASSESNGSQYVSLPAGASPPPSESSSQNTYHNLPMERMKYGTLQPEDM